MSKEADFWMWFPANFSKAEGEPDSKPMRIKGVASTDAIDADDEILLPSGFDYSYLKDKGFINWNHRASVDPSAVIGEPTELKIINNGTQFYVEGFLYDNELGKSVFELGEVLQKNSKTRRLGFSVEGKAIKRQDGNSKIVEKSKITGLAITHQPKNSGTDCQMFKSFQMNEYEELLAESNSLLQKSIEDTETSEEEKEEEAKKKDKKKSLSTESGAALKKESVDGSTKPQDKKTVDTPVFSKGEVELKIIDKFPGITNVNIDKILELIENQKIEKAMKGITEEQIQKAFDLLEKAGSDEIEKASNCTYVKGSKKGTFYKMNAEGERADEKIYKKSGDDYVEEEEESGSDASEPEEPADKEPEEEKGMKKGVDLSPLIAKLQSIPTVESIEKSFSDIESRTGEGFKAISTILKGIYDQIGELGSELQELRETPTNYRKSVGSLQAMALQKSFGAEPIEQAGAGSQVLSKSLDRPAIIGVLEKRTFNGDSIDPMFAKALTLYESSRNVPEEIVSKLKAEGIVITD